MKASPFAHLLLGLIVLAWLSGSLAGGCLPERALDPDRTSVQEDHDRILRAVESKVPSGRTESLRLPVVEEDPLGRTWMAWEEWQTDRSRIGLGRFLENRVVDSRWFGGPGEFALSPDLAFDRSGSPWLIWLASAAHEERVCVLDLASQRKWTFRPEPGAAVTTPKILVDRSGCVWAFWNETGKETGEVVYRILEGALWSKRQTVPRATRYPGLNPDAVVVEDGSIWVVWSSYDGEDYELYYSRCDGSGWQKEVRITDNRVDDGFPSLGVAVDGSPVIAWTRSLASGNQVCSMATHDGRFSGEVVLSAPARELTFPRVSPAAGGKSFVFWKTAQRVTVREVTAFSSGPGKTLPLPPQDPPLIFNPQRNENAYIGFGDSITYGYIDRLPTPQLGYPPRLDILLDQKFGPTEMINEGLGGETTPAGLSRIVQVIAASNARYILIMEGTNDVIVDAISMDTAAFNIREMARRCQAAGLFPTIATIVPRLDWLGVIPYYQNRLLRLNDRIRAIAAELPVSFVDMFTLFNTYPVSDGGVLALLSNDLKHPSEKGYQFMAEAWLDEIQDYPFPPVDIRLRRTNPRTETREVTRLRPSGLQGKFLPARSRKTGNIILWNDNFKIFDPSRIMGYRVYRLRKGDPPANFSFLAQVPAVSRFIDTDLQPLEQYVYIISTLRDDGVEGPCAAPVEEP